VALFSRNCLFVNVKATRELQRRNFVKTVPRVTGEP